MKVRALIGKEWKMETWDEGIYMDKLESSWMASSPPLSSRVSMISPEVGASQNKACS